MPHYRPLFTTMKLYDTNKSHLLTLTWNENEATANRTLNVKVNGADRTVDLSGNLTVESASLVNQDLTTDASPTFAGATFTGNVGMGGNNVTFTSVALVNSEADVMAIRDQTGASDKILQCLDIQPSGGIGFRTDAQFINGPNADNNYLMIRARDNGVGVIEVARIAGAADPYFSVGGSQQHKFYNSGAIDIGSGATIACVGTGASGMILKNLKNAAASALSGTQLDVEIDIGGTPYYFTVYPTKA